jgi:hypothetical protein
MSGWTKAAAVATVALFASRVTSRELQRYVELDIGRNRRLTDTLMTYYTRNGDSGNPQVLDRFELLPNATGVHAATGSGWEEPRRARVTLHLRQHLLIAAYLKTDLAGTKRFLERCDLFTLAESLGGVESLIGHPGLMSHASLPPERRAQLKLTDNLVRLSVGIEDADDLIADLERALGAI